MGEKDSDGLGLSLSMGMGCYGGITQPPLKVNLLPKKPPQSVQNHRSSWNVLFQLPDRNFGGIDMNSAPSMVDCDNDNGGDSSPNSTISSISGRRSDGDPNGDDNNAERASCSHGGDDEDGGGSGDGDAARKKLRLSKEQSMVLEETFKDHNTLNPKRKQALAKQLNLRPRQVEVWFQNRRARTKLKQTEVDCEYLKRCSDNLTEENRRLQKEVQELRALKLSPQLYMHMNPPTTLTMCPSCERVAVSSTSSSVAHSAVSPSNHSRLCPTIHRPVPVNPWPFDRSISQP